MSSPDLPVLWWTFAATMVGSVGTAGALLIAVSTLRKQIDDKRREQASMVTVSQDQWITTIANQGRFPITLWSVQWARTEDRSTHTFSTKFIGVVGTDFRDTALAPSHTDVFPMKVLPEQPVGLNTPRQYPDGKNVELPPDLAMILFIDAHGYSWARLNVGALLDYKSFWRIDLRRQPPHGLFVLKGATISERITAWRFRWRMRQWNK
jgi:hypothetical protein